ncbi:SDR family oxidoreductase [Christiangramia salexigens]|uniref:Tropinone reductase n=1 Tax=Christiangramia salexigens TaxID=1913577 RepID=A0A1L3J835_9FLAO|nr:SDR family oxidoreductase [Christiangramia salexigens]APG61264.1 tropinone reductase [Christiangramia salexigens]
MWKLNNKKALITGGTKGIGRAAVLEFLELGAEVLFTARNKDDIREFEVELEEKGYSATGMVADSAKKGDQDKIKNWIAEHWKQLDILVNNAGINIRKMANEYSEAEYRKVLEINLFAPFEISRSLFQFMKSSGNASIINIASSAATQDVGTGTPYAMSKSGLLQQTRSLAAEWAEFGIRVNAVSPWFTKTPLTSGYLGQKEKMDQILQKTPLNRVAEAEEISAIISFLAMNKSSFITGQNIIADGGMSIKAI